MSLKVSLCKKNLQLLLEEYFGKRIVILECVEKPLVDPGENYGSVILSVDLLITFPDCKKSEKRNFVAKLCPPTEKLCEIFCIQDTFKKELGMYLTAIPALSEFEQKFNILDEYKCWNLFAKCYGGRINFNSSNDDLVSHQDAILLLENLKCVGYEIGDRLTGYDLTHAELMIRNLAYFHAVPIAMKIKEPNVFDRKIRSVLKPVEFGTCLDQQIADAMVMNIADILQQNERCRPYIDLIIDNMRRQFKNFRTIASREPFATIVHTDLWMNNIMTRKNERGEPIHNKIVDFQYAIYNSPLLDLLFLLYGSIMPSVLTKHLDFFLHLYYDTFRNCLEMFQIDTSPFSWAAFEEEIKCVAALELAHILTMYKCILTQKGKIEDLALVDDSVLCNISIASNDYQYRVIYAVLSFIDNKWI